MTTPMQFCCIMWGVDSKSRVLLARAMNCWQCWRNNGEICQNFGQRNSMFGPSLAWDSAPKSHRGIRVTTLPVKIATERRPNNRGRVVSLPQQGAEDEQKDGDVPSASAFCQFCGSLLSLLLCTKCRSTWYCSKACQTRDWKPSHKFLCRILRRHTL